MKYAWIIFSAGLCLGVASAGFFCWSWRARAVVAAENLADCERLSAAISRLGSSPTRAEQTQIADQLISRTISAAMESAGLAESQLLAISPQPGRRVAKSSYVEVSTHVTLRRASLTQLLSLLDAVEANELQLKCTSFRLSPTASSTPTSESTDSWTAELLLTYLVFSPQSARPL